MLQNINIVQYIHIHNLGAQPAQQGETYQLPPNSLGGVISAKRKNTEVEKRKIKTHKAFIDITDNNAGEVLYGVRHTKHPRRNHYSDEALLAIITVVAHYHTKEEALAPTM